MKKRTIEKVALITLVFLLSGAMVSQAALTLSNTAITGDGVFNITAGSSSTIDVGASNTLSLNTTNNGSITAGTGTFTIPVLSFTGATGTAQALTSYLSVGTTTPATLFTVGTSSNILFVGLNFIGVNSSTPTTNLGVQGTFAVNGQSSFTFVSSTNLSASGNIYLNNVSSTNVSSTRITALTSIDSPRGGLTNVSSTRIDATGIVTLGKLASHVNSTGTSPSLSSCGTSPTIVGTDNASLVTAGAGTQTGCTLTFATTFSSAPICTVNQNNTSTLLMFQASSTPTTLGITAYFSTTTLPASMGAVKLSVLCLGID